MDDQFKPGSFGCHEAIHMTSVIIEMIDEYLISHQSIKENTEWLSLADEAQSTLINLYQKIGEKHINNYSIEKNDEAKTS